jgi:hypothetical protein
MSAEDETDILLQVVQAFATADDKGPRGPAFLPSINTRHSASACTIDETSQNVELQQWWGDENGSRRYFDAALLTSAVASRTMAAAAEVTAAIDSWKRHGYMVRLRYFI